MEGIYFAIVAGCNKISPFILCCSINYDTLEQRIRNKFGNELKIYESNDKNDKKNDIKNDEKRAKTNEEYEIPFEFGEIPNNQTEHIVSYTLDTNHIKILTKQKVSTGSCPCRAYLGIFNSIDSIIDFEDIISKLTIL